MNFYSKTCAAGISAVCLLGLVLVLLVPSLPILVPLLVILSVNLLLNLVVHIAVTPSTLGWFLMHAGVLVVSGGALYTQLSSVSGDVVLVADAEPVTTDSRGEMPLPFPMEYAGAERAMKTGGELLNTINAMIVSEVHTNRASEIGISLHRPVLHEGVSITLLPETTNEVVNLRVVRNPAQRTPLVGGAFVLLGFLLHAGLGRARS